MMELGDFTTKKQRADQIWALLLLVILAVTFINLEMHYADVKLASKLSQYYPVYLC